MIKLISLAVLLMLSYPAYAGTGYTCNPPDGEVSVRMKDCICYGEMIENGYSGKVHKVHYRGAMVIVAKDIYANCPVGCTSATVDEEEKHGIEILRKMVLKEECQRQGIKKRMRSFLW